MCERINKRTTNIYVQSYNLTHKYQGTTTNAHFSSSPNYYAHISVNMWWTYYYNNNKKKKKDKHKCQRANEKKMLKFLFVLASA